jgi:hypothetical protein
MAVGQMLSSDVLVARLARFAAFICFAFTLLSFSVWLVG